jgi:hypothetical protein
MRIVALSLLFLSACSGPPGNVPASEVVIAHSSLDDARVWRFQFFDPQGKTLGGVFLKFTGQNAKTCDGQKWKAAQLLDTVELEPPLRDWYLAKALEAPPRYPAYQIKGDSLLVMLNAPQCDDYWMLEGNISDTHAAGYMRNVDISGSVREGSFLGKVEPMVSVPPNNRMQRSGSP